MGKIGGVVLEVGTDLQGVSQEQRAKLDNQLLLGIGRAAYGKVLVTIQTLRVGDDVDLFVRLVTGERPPLERPSGALMAMRSAPGQLQAIAPTNCGVNRPGLKDALGVTVTALMWVSMRRTMRT